MTTTQQLAANQVNARRSTGPKSASGKAMSSRNARRHGVTGALDPTSITTWYRIILDDADAVPDPFEREPYLCAAVKLAQAEAHLQRVREAEEQWMLTSKLPLSPVLQTLREMRKDLQSAAAEVGWDAKGFQLLGRQMRMVDRERSKQQAIHDRLGRTLPRYRASAEARRRKALRRWIEEITKRSHGQKDILSEC